MSETPITNQHIAAALGELSMMKFFPNEPIQQKSIGAYLKRLCVSAESLSWLVRQLVDHVSQWPGPSEIRGIYCTRFRPADGVEGYSSLPGFTVGDSEMKHLENHHQYLAASKQSAQDMLDSIAGEKVKVKTVPGGKR